MPRTSNNRRYHVMRMVLAGLLLVVTVTPVRATEPLPRHAAMKLLFCAYGSIGAQPMPLPAGFENQFAVAVVEVNSTHRMANTPLPQVTLLYPGGKSIGTKRVVFVNVLDEPSVPGEGDTAFYLNADPRGNTGKWDGTLPAGIVHLRVRVALATQSFVPEPKSCRVTLGPYEVEGPTDGSWPT